MFLQSCNSFVSLYILLLCHTTSSHLSEHLASNCTATFKYFRDRHFCLNCAIWLFGQTCKCMHPLCTLPTPPHPTSGTHTLTSPKPSVSFWTPIHPMTHIHPRTLLWILSAMLSWGSRPVRSPRRSGDQGRKSLSRPQAPPSAPCLGSGSWEADAMQAPSVACFCGQSV